MVPVLWSQILLVCRPPADKYCSLSSALIFVSVFLCFLYMFTFLQTNLCNVSELLINYKIMTECVSPAGEAIVIFSFLPRHLK